MLRKGASHTAPSTLRGRSGDEHDNRARFRSDLPREGEDACHPARRAIPPAGVKLRSNDWCHTNPLGKALCQLYRKGVYEVAIGDAKGLHALATPLRAQSFPYCFSADGLRVLLTQERSIVEIDLVTYQAVTLHTTRREGTPLCGYVGEGIYQLVGTSLSFHHKRGSSLEELWRCDSVVGIESVFDTGGPVLALLPKKEKKGKSPLVLVHLDDKGFRHLCRVERPELVSIWFHRPSDGSLRVFARDGWSDDVCSWYEIHGVEVPRSGPPDTRLLERETVKALPKAEVAREPRAPARATSAAQKAIAKVDSIGYTKLINLHGRYFSGLDLGADSTVVEAFSWTTAPWKELLDAFGQDQALVLFAKYMTYMYFEYQPTLVRLWRRVAEQHPNDELVARLCVRVLLVGSFQKEHCVALMEPALARGERDWISLVRDTLPDAPRRRAGRIAGRARAAADEAQQEELTPNDPSATREANHVGERSDRRSARHAIRTNDHHDAVGLPQNQVMGKRAPGNAKWSGQSARSPTVCKNVLPSLVGAWRCPTFERVRRDHASLRPYPPIRGAWDLVWRPCSLPVEAPRTGLAIPACGTSRACRRNPWHRWRRTRLQRNPAR